MEFALPFTMNAGKCKSLGQALQLISALQFKNSSVLDTLRLNWKNIFHICENEFTPVNYNPNTKVLIISTNLASIYVQHYHDELITRINDFFGDEIVKLVKFKNK